MTPAGYLPREAAQSHIMPAWRLTFAGTPAELKERNGQD